MKVCAVIDTNVIVSALITKNSQSPPCMVLREVLDGRITPLFHDDIIDEYAEVLNRPKFHLKAETIQTMINSIISNGIKVDLWIWMTLFFTRSQWRNVIIMLMLSREIRNIIP